MYSLGERIARERDLESRLAKLVGACAEGSENEAAADAAEEADALLAKNNRSCEALALRLGELELQLRANVQHCQLKLTELEQRQHVQNILGAPQQLSQESGESREQHTAMGGSSRSQVEALESDLVELEAVVKEHDSKLAELEHAAEKQKNVRDSIICSMCVSQTFKTVRQDRMRIAVVSWVSNFFADTCESPPG